MSELRKDLLRFRFWMAFVSDMVLEIEHERRVLGSWWSKASYILRSAPGAHGATELLYRNKMHTMPGISEAFPHQSRDLEYVWSSNMSGQVIFVFVKGIG